MSELIALIIVIVGCVDIYLTAKSFVRMKKEKKIFPKISRFSLLYGSFFGVVLIFLGFDIIFKWI